MILCYSRTPAALIGALFLFLAPGAIAQGDPPEMRRIQALERMIGGKGTAALERFIEEDVDPHYLDAIGRATLLERLGELRRAAHGFGGIGVMPKDDGSLGVELMTDSQKVVLALRLQEKEPFRITFLEIAGIEKHLELGRVDWNNLDAFLRQQEGEGFAGTVLVVRGGKTVLHEAYGMADAERGIPNTINTIFDIGSTPIDFTHAALLLLVDRGVVSLDDGLERWFDGVPADKRAITLDQLRTGRSGLPNFHHDPAKDQDHDLSWIDRDTAIERIFAQELLFAPGSAVEHSHSAWGLLAAVIEIASGQSYGEFLSANIFEPLGMTRTGLYALTLKLDEREIAVGQTEHGTGERNSPRYWGPTSWLVMGSGGMVSTPGDLERFRTGIRGGKLLSPASAERFPKDGLGVGGNDRGFLCGYWANPGTHFVLCSNSHVEMGDLASAVMRALLGLVSEP